LPNGEVRSGTLEQLSEAFRSGHVGGATLVRSAGSDQWSPLVDVLRAAAPAPVAAPPVASVRPVSLSALAVQAQPPPAVAVAAPAPVASAPPPAAPAPLHSVPPSTGISTDPDAWHVRLPTGQVRSGTREQLEEAFRAGHLAENLLVLASGARSWVELGVLMRSGEAPPPAVAPPAPPPAPVAMPAAVVASPPSAAPGPPPPSSVPVSGDVWQVRLPDGQVRSGTLQQLEEAFNAGHLDENTLVLAVGATEWLPLRTAAARYASAAPEATPVPSEETPAVPALAVQAVAATEAAESPTESAERPVDHQQAAQAAEQEWQVRLNESQLEAAVQAGLLGADALVMAPGTDQWIRLGDLPRGQSAATG
jgi:hypothetical protein